MASFWGVCEGSRGGKRRTSRRGAGCSVWGWEATDSKLVWSKAASSGLPQPHGVTSEP